MPIPLPRPQTDARPNRAGGRRCRVGRGRLRASLDGQHCGVARRVYNALQVGIRVKPATLNAPIGSVCPVSAGSTCFDVSRESDSLGRVLRASDQLGGVSRFWFDGAGNPTGIEGVDQQRSTAQYNAIGQRLALSDPDMGRRTFVYNALGEVLSQTDARGVAPSCG